MKKTRQYSIVISPDPSARLLSRTPDEARVPIAPRECRGELRYFTPRRDSSSSACRPNARGAALLHLPQLGVHRARSTGCPDLGGFVRRDNTVRTREFLCVILRIRHAQAWEQLHLRRPDTRAGGIAFPFLSGRSVRKRYGCFTHVQRGISVEDHVSDYIDNLTQLVAG